MQPDAGWTNCCGVGSGPGVPQPTNTPDPGSGNGNTGGGNTGGGNTGGGNTGGGNTSMAASLTADYSALILYARNLGQPVQGLDGTVTGGDGGAYTVTLYVRDPDGSEIPYNLSTPGAFAFDADDASDDDFGTTEQGSWTAWIEASDTSGNTATSSSVVWDVSWYPVHESP